MPTTEEIMSRCRKLGLECDTFPTDVMSSVLASLACFPMYMVAHVDAWTEDRQFRVPGLDLPGSESIRESFVLGSEEAKLAIDKQHSRLLATLLAHPKPCDRVFYEYAIETLQLALDAVSADLAEQIRAAIARMIVAVARASGEGIGGSGSKVSPQEKSCIEDIDKALSLSSSQKATAELANVYSQTER